ncbi:MAG TPA: glycine cleavage T C-terminal barrel domain-containing protein [Gemmatimonadaceae bacterium]|nr:glycine cleavage T C-terminal barrel domain-containing protein [Gemmatimonadaceae bacterium]
MLELNGRRLGIDSSVTADYESFHDGCALVDYTDRGRMRFHGAGAKDALNGILTCDVAPLANGHGAYGVALTSKGKVVADVSVFAMDDSFLVEVPPAVWPAWKELVAKYVNPRVSRRTDETDLTCAIGLFGPKAASVVAAMTGAAESEIEALSPYAHVTHSVNDIVVNVARIPDLGVEGFRLMAVRDAHEPLRERAIAEGARVVSAAAVEAARIEAGRPLWGADMDDSTLPQEANLESLGAISYTKGCYTGQEVVARLHFRGHVNKRLMGLRLDGASVPARGATIMSGEGKESGDVRSVVVSPRFGPIALAMVRREVNAGDAVTVPVDGTEARATVASLPFGA